jgi:replicative DNA helicase
MISKKVLACMVKDAKSFNIISERDIKDDLLLGNGSKILFRLLKEYHKHYNDLPSRDDVESLLENSGYSKEDKTETLSTFIEVSNLEIISNISFLLDSLIEENKKRIITDSLIKATQSMEEGTWKRSIDVLRDGVIKVDSLVSQKFEETMNASTETRLKRYEESKNGIDTSLFTHTGFPTLDRVTGGMQQGEIWIVAGWLKSGKSLFLLNMGYNAWCFGKSVLYISAELSQIQLARRFDSLACNIPYDKIKFGNLNEEEDKQYKTFLEELKSKENLFHIVFQPGCNVSNVYQKVREMKERGKLDLIIVDYLGLLYPDRKFGSREEKLSNVALELRDLAGIEQVPILTAHQINREGFLAGKTGAEYASYSTDVPRHADMYFSIRIENNEDNRAFINRGIINCKIEAARDCELASFRCDVFWDRMKIQERSF